VTLKVPEFPRVCCKPELLRSKAYVHFNAKFSFFKRIKI